MTTTAATTSAADTIGKVVAIEAGLSRLAKGSAASASSPCNGTRSKRIETAPTIAANPASCSAAAAARTKGG
jgi:hypothetical protein